MTLRVLHLDPLEVICTEPISCCKCGWSGDAEEHAGQYKVLEGVPPSYPWAADGDVLCQDCTLACDDCGEGLMDGGCFIGLVFDKKLYCESCFALNLCAGE